jgi:hypothetical protein
MFLDGIRVQFGASTMALDKSGMRRLEYPGFTPLRQWADGKKSAIPWLPEKPGIAGPSPRNQNPEFVETPTQIGITQRLDSRICKVLQVAGGFLTFNLRGAPYARMKTLITINMNRIFTIEFYGSAIPSQLLYVDWKLAPARGGGFCYYDMLKATTKEMDDFFGAGRMMYVGRTRRAPVRPAGALVYDGVLV